MDIKREIKEEAPISEVNSEIQRESFSQETTVELDSNAAVWSKAWEMEIKTGIKEEAVASEFCSQNEGNFASKDHVINTQYNKDCKVADKAEIQEESQPERTSIDVPYADDENNDAVDESFPSAGSIRKTPAIKVHVPFKEPHALETYPEIKAFIAFITIYKTLQIIHKLNSVHSITGMVIYSRGIQR